MTKVKICGLTRLADVEIVNKYLPDYIGLIFAPSRRQLALAQAKEFARELSPEIKKVGVFVNSPREQVQELADACQLDILQFHGQESPEDCLGYSQKVWKGFSVKNAGSLKHIEHYQVDGILVDSYLPGIPGGTGITFNWDLVTDLAKRHFLILAGGLQTSNVQQAIKQVQPGIIDVSSGVETDGIKDEEKIKRFIEKVRKQR